MLHSSSRILILTGFPKDNAIGGILQLPALYDIDLALSRPLPITATPISRSIRSVYSSLALSFASALLFLASLSHCFAVRLDIALASNGLQRPGGCTVDYFVFKREKSLEDFKPRPFYSPDLSLSGPRQSQLSFFSHDWIQFGPAFWLWLSLSSRLPKNI